MMNETNNTVPGVPMAMLTRLELRPEHWVALAKNASWQTTRMNLNTFERHGVFDDDQTVHELANRLRDPALIAKARVLAYQLMVAYTNASTAPRAIREALQDAMELATRNIPAIAGRVWVFPDVSGSMQSPVTGHRKGATSAVRCLDVAALVAASVLRSNASAGVVPFSTDVVLTDLNPRDSVMSNAQKLASLPSGGTNCSAPLRWLNSRSERGDLVLYVSDNESWMDSGRRGSATQTLAEWEAFKQRNPKAKLVCLDLQPNGTTQAREREDILNIGGFSDSVFEVIAKFAAGTLDGGHWVGVINGVVV
jgi:60 kDa SS-A/Ro ribonucleoprotein